MCSAYDHDAGDCVTVKLTLLNDVRVALDK